MIGTTFKKVSIGLALGATLLGAAVPAQARDHGNRWNDRDRYEQRQDRYDRYDRYERGDRYAPYYDSRVRYQYGDRYYRGDRCRNDGAAGTIIGAIAGGLIGNSVAGHRGDRTAGTIIGGAVGAVAGRAIDKSDDRC